MFPPLQIGNVRIGHPVVQAALSGYSDWAMRVLARRMGAPYTLCEVMLDQFLLGHSHFKKNQARIRVTDEEHPVGGQLMGADPADFGPAAARLVEIGFDIIDINFGCPVKKALGRCRGGYHLGQPAVALEIVDRVRAAVPPHIPVTLKMRRGLDDTPASRDKFYTILDGAFARGAAAITVHGRTVRQGYIGPSRWEFLSEVKRHVGDRVILGSGDLFTPQACVEMLQQTGVNGVTAARGAIGNPWIFAQTRALLAGEPLPPPPSTHEQKGVIDRHFDLAVELYGGDIAGRLMRKFCIKYARLHPAGVVVRDAFVAAKNITKMREVFDLYYTDDLPGRHPDADEVDQVQECG
ncbi:MAG: tRNA-dihydrouridine synthase [Pirellulales bacterium]|nr:tRNA-dihydrouridine synthase [Pirellulales bacterium]